MRPPLLQNVRGAEAGMMLVTLVLAGATVLGDASGGEATRLLIIDSVIGLLSAGLMPLLVRRPTLGATLLVALAVASPAATPGASIAVMHVGWRRPFGRAAAVATLAAATHLLRWVWLPYPGLSFGWWVVLVITADGALLGWGALMRARGALVASLRERAVRAEAEQGRRVAEARAQERAAIAREMHDVLAHRLSLLATYAGALEYRPDAPPERLAEAAGVIRGGVHDALDELRDVIAVLHDTEADASGAAGDRPQPTLADITRLVDECKAAGMQITLVYAAAGTPTPTIGRTAYRLVQEALTNARKHAPDQPVHLSIKGSAGSALEIEVSNRVAASSSTVLPSGGTGLVGLTERVRLVGGRLDHRVTGDRVFVLHARLPWPT
ncbi:sensor histidine kinase [Leekyejoonella antrihumi]|uniref:histidine kinase n=2 Tax=Leekyejoonella antrihumi TaxID=1660198 RepID=A0A563DW88_9MICO|nr:sensor histidine kinase [Leekyejoonella antrihumi]